MVFPVRPGGDLRTRPYNLPLVLGVNINVAGVKRLCQGISAISIFDAATHS